MSDDSAPIVSMSPAPDEFENVRKCPKCPTPSTSDTPPDLTEKQLAALDLLLTGATDLAVAKALDISPRTLYRWRNHHPAFRAELAQRRQCFYESTLDRFLVTLSRSLDTLDHQVTDRYAPTAHRASRTILAMSRLGQHLYNSVNPKPARSPDL
jgi:hypothetical protein